MADRRTDELYAALAQQAGGIEPLLDSFFEFLHRKTDFYVVTRDPTARGMGFAPGVAQQKVMAAFQKHPLKHLDPQSKPAPAPSASRAKPKRLETAAAATEPAAAVRLTDAGKQLPEGNGGRTDKYSWTQTLEDLTIQLPLPAGSRSKDVDCQIRSTHLRVALRDPPVVVLDGDLPEKVRADESLWSIDAATHTMQISLEKIKCTWWASALVGDAEIDTNQVDSTRSITEYDDATQGAIRKAMFDEQQRQRGLPTSDEMATEQILAQARHLPNAPPI